MKLIKQNKGWRSLECRLPPFTPHSLALGYAGRRFQALYRLLMLIRCAYAGRCSWPRSPCHTGRCQGPRSPPIVLAFEGPIVHIFPLEMFWGSPHIDHFGHYPLNLTRSTSTEVLEPPRFYVWPTVEIESELLQGFFWKGDFFEVFRNRILLDCTWIGRNPIRNVASQNMVH